MLYGSQPIKPFTRFNAWESFRPSASNFARYFDTPINKTLIFKLRVFLFHEKPFYQREMIRN